MPRAKRPVDPGESAQAGAREDASVPAVTPRDVGAPDTTDLSTARTGPVTVQVSPQGHVTITITPTANSIVPGSDSTLEAFTPKGFLGFGGGGPTEVEGQPNAFQQVLDKLKSALDTLGSKIVDFTNDVTTLEVRTFVSERIEDVRPDGAAGFTFAQQRAMTYVDFDGDTQVVVPVDAGQIDEALWMIHLQTVEQAQAHRQAMLRTVGELVTGFIPAIR